MKTTPLNTAKFQDPLRTLDGKVRASVPFVNLETLWFNTGTVCNLTCENCYIESSPTNDALTFLTVDDVSNYIDELRDGNYSTQEIGFTGGEPFVNPHMNAMIRIALEASFDVMVLTNAMRPMQRKTVFEELLALRHEFGSKLKLRVSLDHHTSLLHERERGIGSWKPAIKGIDWLIEYGFVTHIAGRTCWGESEADARDGYGDLFQRRGWAIDAYSPRELVLFPEMELETDLPEISEGCWSILGKKTSDMMCASSRMIVKRKGHSATTIVACTLLPYSDEFDLGPSLAAMSKSVTLNHPHCARFCVLGGASCSG